MDFKDAAAFVTATDEENNAQQNQVIEKTSLHPIVSGLHITLKVIPLVAYVLFFLFMSGYFVIPFSICLCFTAIDFWVTKNINGRLMAGLRWWNQVNDDGTSAWIFEALEDKQKVRLSYVEMMIFWISLLAAPIAWFATMFLCFVVVRINYLGLALIGFVMTGLNLIGFIVCARGSRALLKKRVKKVAVEQGTKAAISAATSQFA
ncbi:hypothetical protein QTN25_002857 [Entamoeba marina]